MTRSGTATVGRYDYAAFGRLKSQLGLDVCRFKFSSKERDLSTGFSYFGYRFYAPQCQRWTNRDPIGERDDLNIYGFVMNDPVGHIDALGLWGSVLIIIQCAQLPNKSLADCVCEFVAPDEEECKRKVGGCVNFIGSKFKDLGELCDCFCGQVLEIKKQTDQYNQCVKRCKCAKSMQKLFKKLLEEWERKHPPKK